MSHKNIHEAKLAVMAAVPYVRKVKSEGLSYTYASERQLIGRIRPAMVENGIDVAPVVTAPLCPPDSYTTSKGGTMQRMRLLITYRFTHAESGTHQEVQVVGEAADTGDKVASKCMTMALKYALTQWLLIERGDDPDKTPSSGSDNKRFANAKAWIDASETEAALATVQSRIEKSQFSDTERKSLNEHVEQHRAALRGKRAPATTPNGSR